MDYSGESSLIINAILENTLNEIYVFQADDLRILDANKGAVENLGYNLEELRQLSAVDIKPDCTEESYREQISPLLAKKQKKIHFETRHKRKNGTTYEASVNLELCQFDGQEVILSIVLDVTEDKKMEELVQQVQKMESIGLMAGGISHDFNNILHGISLAADLTITDLDKDSRAWDNLSKIKSYTRRGRELVKQILTFSRKDDDQLQAVNLIPAIRESMKMIRSTIPASVFIGQKYGTEELFVKANPTKLHQIMVNLCTNSFHAVKDKEGVIEVNVSEQQISHTAPPYLNLPDGHYARLTVKDNGTGIPDDIKERIFEPFFTTKPKNEGTGLGLSVVHGIILSHKGAIRVESSENAGTLFEMFFPLTAERTAAQEPIKEVETVRGQEHVILVDDEDVNLMLQKRMLERLGYQVTEFNDSLKALETLEKEPQTYDLLITDQTMPDLTGIALAEKAVALNNKLPVIISSGYADILRSEQSEDSVISAFISKPFTKEEISATIRGVLNS